jgi:peptidoglycan hydrolase-like protein with peptidoglycan-binding domain
MFRITNYFTPILIKALFYLSSLLIIIATVIYSLESYKSYRDVTNYSPSLVAAIQKAVMIEIDGIYGDETKDEVELFQDNHGLTSDGLVGRLTWEEFYNQGQIDRSTYEEYLLEINSESIVKPKKEGSFFNLINFILIFITPIISFFLIRISLEYYYSLFNFLQMKVQTKKNISNDDTALSFWSFTKMITPNSLGIIYILGVILSLSFVVLYHESLFLRDLSLLFIFLIFICFQVIWRLSIEFYAVLFDFLTAKE